MNKGGNRPSREKENFKEGKEKTNNEKERRWKDEDNKEGGKEKKINRENESIVMKC